MGGGSEEAGEEILVSYFYSISVISPSLSRPTTFFKENDLVTAIVNCSDTEERGAGEGSSDVPACHPPPPPQACHQGMDTRI